MFFLFWPFYSNVWFSDLFVSALVKKLTWFVRTRLLSLCRSSPFSHEDFLSSVRGRRGKAGCLNPSRGNEGDDQHIWCCAFLHRVMKWWGFERGPNVHWEMNPHEITGAPCCDHVNIHERITDVVGFLNQHRITRIVLELGMNWSDGNLIKEFHSFSTLHFQISLSSLNFLWHLI